MSRKKILIFTALLIMVCAMIIGGVKTRMDMKPLPVALSDVTGMVKKPRILDRRGIPLTTTYTGVWNIHDQRALYEIPPFLKQAFIFSEDKRFYDHGGVDWWARFHALFQNIKAGRAVRGASTITEQVVRLIHPRPRTLWSRWIEGFEAHQLEKTNSKQDILWFYLNQVPYASRRRGISQAARFYFDRDVESLNQKESMALALLVRAPDYYDLYRHPGRINAPLAALAGKMEQSKVHQHAKRASCNFRVEGECSKSFQQKILSPTEQKTITPLPFELKPPALSVKAPHFARFVLSHPDSFNRANTEKIHTTLNGTLQQRVQTLMDTALISHRDKKVHNGAALVVDHKTGEILAWAVGKDKKNLKTPITGQYRKQDQAKAHGQDINAVTAPRQPGSAMKPFVYAMALEKGWTAATLIQDSPLAAKVGVGLHAYHNYSGQYYGAVTLRNALGNSLNIPAVRTIQFVGVGVYLTRLRELGFTTLNQHPDFYGDGLALGNGEVSLYELVQAYTVLANQGRFIALRTIADTPIRHPRQIFSSEVTSLMGHILSDAGARTLEFDGGGLLNFPVQTAVKTGTSSDYRDAWAMGYNYNFTVGVWMGNLDGSPTRGMTGSRGPAFVLRSIFARLNQMEHTRPLYMSPRLVRREIINENNGPAPHKKNARQPCYNSAVKTEWFIPGTKPLQSTTNTMKDIMQWEAYTRRHTKKFGFIQPLNGMHLAMDPRIPDDHEVLACRVAGVQPGDRLSWYLDGCPLNVTGSRFNWKVQPGKHILEVAMVHPVKPGQSSGKETILTDRVRFLVK